MLLCLADAGRINVFLLSICLCVYLFGCNFWLKYLTWKLNFWVWWIYLDHIYVKIRYQGNWVKIKVTHWKMILRPQFSKLLIRSVPWTRLWSYKDQGHLKVNFKCLTFYRQAGGGPSTERRSCSSMYVSSGSERSLVHKINFSHPLTTKLSHWNYDCNLAPNLVLNVNKCLF